MGWARFDDEYVRHPKIQQIDPAVRADAIALEVAGLCYSGRLLTDGFISSAATTSLAHELGFERYRNGRSAVDFRRLQVALDALIECGRWRVQGAAGYTIHDYPDYQPTASDVKERRRRETEKKRKQRAQGRLSLDLSRGDNPRDRESASPESSPRDTSRASATGARAPARPAPTPRESASSALSPQGEANPSTPPAAAQKAAPLGGGGELPQEVAFREANRFVVTSEGWRDPHLEQKLREEWPELIEEDVGSLLATADEMREREVA